MLVAAKIGESGFVNGGASYLQQPSLSRYGDIDELSLHCIARPPDPREASPNEYLIYAHICVDIV